MSRAPSRNTLLGRATAPIASSPVSPRRVLLVTTLSLLVCLSAAQPARAEPRFLFLDVVEMAGFSKDDVRQLRDDALVGELEVADRSRQVAFAGIIRVDSAGTRFAEALAATQVASTAEAAEAYGRFEDPATPDDIASLRFPDGDIGVLPSCKVSECKFKLSRPEIDHLSTIDWSRKQSGQEFTQRFRERVLAYVQLYRQEGNAGLIVYADKPQPGNLSTTLESILGRFASFERHAPELADYLRRYPESKSANITDSIEWSVKDFGYRPTLAVDHLVIEREPAAEGALALMARKTIYANHYLAGRVQMGAMVDAADALGEPGRFIVLVDRIEFDDEVSGLKRQLLGRVLLSDMEERMEILRDFADAPR